MPQGSARLSVVGEAFVANDRPRRTAVYTATQFRGAEPPTGDDCTLYHLFAASCKTFASRDCLGERVVDANGQAGDYAFWTYKETAERVEHVASALAASGIKKGEKVGIHGHNCREWMLAIQACNRMGYVCVPVCGTFSRNAVEYILSNAECTATFVEGAEMDRIASAVWNELEFNGPVIYWGQAAESAIDSIRAKEGTMVYSFEEFMELGGREPVSANPPRPTDLCTIMYTGGSTGDPKGVMLTHRAMATGVRAFRTWVERYLPDGLGTRYLSIMTLAHIFDRMAEELSLASGIATGYSQRDICGLMSDIRTLRPTMFVAVPRIFERMYNELRTPLRASRFLRRAVFWRAYAQKLRAIQSGIPQARASRYYDMIVFRQIKARLGGRVKLFVSGGAPIANHIEEFFRVCLCADVVQGYGMTETCACAFLQNPDDPTMIGTVGPSVPFAQFCLESIPDMNCNATGEKPAGEVCIKCPALFNGYYNRPDLTAEVVDKDGWFHTGDVGIIAAEEGKLRIFDRRANIVKLAQGELLAFDRVYGHPEERYPIAIVVPPVEYVRQWAVERDRDFDYAALCNDPDLTRHILQTLTSEVRGELNGFEVVRAMRLESEPFTMENGLLTPVYNLRRHQLKQKYQTVIADLYAYLRAIPN